MAGGALVCGVVPAAVGTVGLGIIASGRLRGSRAPLPSATEVEPRDGFRRGSCSGAGDKGTHWTGAELKDGRVAPLLPRPDSSRASKATSSGSLWGPPMSACNTGSAMMPDSCSSLDSSAVFSDGSCGRSAGSGSPSLDDTDELLVGELACFFSRDAGNASFTTPVLDACGLLSITGMGPAELRLRCASSSGTPSADTCSNGRAFSPSLAHAMGPSTALCDLASVPLSLGPLPTPAA